MSDFEKPPLVDENLLDALELTSSIWKDYFENPVGTEQEFEDGIIEVLATHMVGTEEQRRAFSRTAQKIAKDLYLVEEYAESWKS